MESELVRRHQELPDVWSFYFTKPPGWRFDAGDYSEIELSSGRRWFTIASAPHEPLLQFTIKFPPHPSRFKRDLLKLEPDSQIRLSPPIGNFNLPLTKDKLLFVAAGIGITPYRSLISDLIQRQLKHDVELIYTARGSTHIFPELTTRLKSPYYHDSIRGRLTFDDIKARVTDSTERIVYLAGPEPMMDAMHSEFLRRGHPRPRLKLEYFTGHTEI